MAVFIISEEGFSTSGWCRDITEGIRKCAAKMKVPVYTEDILFGKTKHVPTENDVIAVTAHNPGKLNEYIIRADRMFPSRIMVVGAHTDLPGISCVYADTDYAVKSVLTYLASDCQKTSTALYGADPTLYADIKKISAFPEKGSIYYNRGNLSECFESFRDDMERYDSVICTNDYTAISLINGFKGIGYTFDCLPFIVSLANTRLAICTNPSITSVTNDERLLGETAMNVCSLLFANENTGAFHIGIKPKICPRDTTDHIPVTAPELATLCHNPMTSSTSFYKDEEVEALQSIEKLLCDGDTSDITILSMLADGRSYDEIAEKASLSVGGVKYRIGTYTSRCGLCGNKELKRLLVRYFM